MKIETLIEQLKPHKRVNGSLSKDAMNAVMGLISRLEGMLPDVEKARAVAAAIGEGDELDESVRSATLAWARVVWPAFEKGKLDALRDAVTPLLPEGQPFGQSEFDAVGDEIVMAAVEGRGRDEAAARRRHMLMSAYNYGIKGQ